MIYLVVFALAVAAGWRISFKWGGAAERETMCLLTVVWLGTIVANLTTHSIAPTEYYAPMDLFALCWLWAHQRRNWQWIVAGIFAAMLLTHLTFFVGTHSGRFPYQGRPYQDILAILAYGQIGIMGWASYERARTIAGHRVSRLGHWALASDWLFHKRTHHGANAEPQG